MFIILNSYRNVYFHKRTDIILIHSAFRSPGAAETKNAWARDDPAIIILIAACLSGMVCVNNTLSRKIELTCVVSAIAWSLVYSYTPYRALQLVFLMIFRDYLLVGIVVATILWYVLITPVFLPILILCAGFSRTVFYCLRLLILPPQTQQ